MRHLAAVLTRAYGGDLSKLSGVNLDKLPTEEDRSKYQSLLKRYNGDEKKLLRELAEVDDEHKKAYAKCEKDGTGLAEYHKNATAESYNNYENRVKNTKQVTVSGGQAWLERDPLKTAVQADGSFVALSPGKGGAINKKIFKGKRIVLDAAQLKLDAEAIRETLRSFGATNKNIILRFGKKPE